MKVCIFMVSLSRQEVKAKPLDIPKEVVLNIIKHAAWYIVKFLEDANTPKCKILAKSLASKYSTNSLKHESITFVFERGNKSPANGHRFVQNMAVSSLVREFGKPKKPYINVVMGMISNPSSVSSGYVAGEYDEKKFQLSVYLLSLPSWSEVNLQKLSKNPSPGLVTNMLIDVERAVSHELIHAIQDLYPIDEGEIPIPKNATPQEKYFLKPDEFIPLLYNIEQLYYDHLKTIVGKLDAKQKKNVTFIKKLRQEVLAVLTGQKIASSAISEVKTTTKPSAFFLALKKHNAQKWQEAVAILQSKDKQFKLLV